MTPATKPAPRFSAHSLLTTDDRLGRSVAGLVEVVSVGDR
jgi:hypothetical protein